MGMMRLWVLMVASAFLFSGMAFAAVVKDKAGAPVKDKTGAPVQTKAPPKEAPAKMKATGHPFILGSECDVLSVEGCEKAIRTKVAASMNCDCGH
jgi:hypothetical protein